MRKLLNLRCNVRLLKMQKKIHPVIVYERALLLFSNAIKWVCQNPNHSEILAAQSPTGLFRREPTELNETVPVHLFIYFSHCQHAPRQGLRITAPALAMCPGDRNNMESTAFLNFRHLALSPPPPKKRQDRVKKDRCMISELCGLMEEQPSSSAQIYFAQNL